MSTVEAIPSAVTVAIPAERSNVPAIALRGALWSYGGFLLAKLATFGSTVVLARLLAPEDFGVMSLGLALMTYVDALNDFGIGQAVVHFDDDERTRSTAFALTMLTGAVAACALAVLSEPLAHVLDEPRLAPVSRALAVSYVIISLGSVHSALLRRRMQFRRRFVPELAKSVLKAGVAIVLARRGFGVWSLVWAQLAGVGAATLGNWWALRWRPRQWPDVTTTRKVASYGGATMLVTFLAVIARDVDFLIVGRALGAEELGRYTLGFRLPDLAIMGVTYAVSQALFPALNRLRDDDEALRRAYLAALRLLVLVTAPLGAGIALAAHDFVAIAYGAQWARTAPVLALIGIYFVTQAAVFVAGDVYKALGRQRLLWIITFVRSIVVVTAVLLVVGHGIVAVALAQVVIGVLACSTQLAIAARFIGVGAGALLDAIRPAAIVVAAMVPSTVTVQLVMAGADPLPRLLAVALVGAAAGGCAAAFVARSVLIDVRARLRSR